MAMQRNKKRIVGYIVISISLLLVVAGSMSTGYIIANGDNETVKSVFNKSLGQPNYVGNSELSKKKLDFSYFWKAWGIIDDQYYGNQDEAKRLNGAISGMVAGLNDPYTVYLGPAENEIFKSDLKGEFGGIGAELTLKNGNITIVAPMSGTPAEKVGLRSNDIILEVDGKKVADYTFNEAITHIRGDVGTKVKLMIVRADVEQPFEVEVTRELITVNSVKQDNLDALAQLNDVPGVSDPSFFKDIAYIKINQFGDDTTDSVRNSLTEAAASKKKGAILDLRNNPGGYLNSAVDIIGMVLPNNVQSDKEPLKRRVAVIEKGKSQSQDIRANTSAILPDLPMVVLVNGGSASASEIFSGAMKDYGRAKVIGTKTFGKGSVQNLVELGNGGSVKVTIAKWFTPLDHGIDGRGIEPDVKVELADKETLSSSDSQVKKAMEILAAEVK